MECPLLPSGTRNDSTYRLLPSAVAAAALRLLLYWPVFARLVQDWLHDDNYSHGFLIVPLALYFAWERRQRAGGTRPRPSSVSVWCSSRWAGDARWPGLLGAELFLTRVSLIVALVGGDCSSSLGWQRARGAGVSAGVPAADDSDSGHHLQSDRVSAAVARLAGRRGGPFGPSASRCCAKAT